MARGNGQPKTVTTNRGYEPSVRDLEIYRELCKGRTLRSVGDDYGITFQAVAKVREKVRRHLAPLLQKQITGIKVDQTHTLDHILNESMAAWEKSKTMATEETDVINTDLETTHTLKKKSSAGNPSFLAEARAAMADIRKIWDVEKHYEREGINALNPAGMKRDDYRKKVAEAKIAELQGLVSELQGAGDG